MPVAVPPPTRGSCGFSLTELMAAVAIIGVLGAMALARHTSLIADGERASCHVNRAEVEIQCRLWRRSQGAWPAANLTGIGTNASYFPEGVPPCPVDGSAYTIDAGTGRVVGHDH
ncbi:MAG: type IV pilin protein [Lacipirellulaceae bacterium]